MRVYTTSDIHVDFPDNEKWVSELSHYEYQQDILLLAGDLTDRIPLLEKCFRILAQKFLKVFFVPGNHELWVHNDTDMNSLQKFDTVLEIAKQEDINTNVYEIGQLTIVPLFSWYDFSFAKPEKRLEDAWVDFRACQWPEHFTISDVNQYFLNKNQNRLHYQNKMVISFSHFLPSLKVMPFYIPRSQDYLHPIFGSEDLGRQVEKLNPDIHIYGHSHVNNRTQIGKTLYINNAFGYPSETRIANKQLILIYDE